MWGSQVRGNQTEGGGSLTFQYLIDATKLKDNFTVKCPCASSGAGLPCSLLYGRAFQCATEFFFKKVPSPDKERVFPYQRARESPEEVFPSRALHKPTADATGAAAGTGTPPGSPATGSSETPAGRGEAVGLAARAVVTERERGNVTGRCARRGCQLPPGPEGSAAALYI